MEEMRLGGADYENIVNSIINYSKSIMPLSDYEAQIIRNAISVVNHPVPSTKLLLTTDIDKMISAKGELNYIIMKLKDIRRSYKIPHDNCYNKGFTTLTKMGRPSTESKIAEIYHTNPEMQEWRDKLSDIDNLLEFLNSYIGLIDSSIRNMESRRYDLA